MDRTQVAVGETLRVAGSGFRPAATLVVRIDPQADDPVLATVTATRAQTFTVEVTVPQLTAGRHGIGVSGAEAQTCLAPPAANVVVVAGTGAGTGAGGSNEGGRGAGGALSYTGVDITAGVVIAGALLVAGATMLGVGRRSRGWPGLRVRSRPLAALGADTSSTVRFRPARWRGRKG